MSAPACAIPSAGERFSQRQKWFMLPEDRDDALLWDMREACRAVAEFIASVKYSRFEQDKLLRSAVERQFLILGEAASRIDLRSAYGYTQA